MTGMLRYALLVVGLVLLLTGLISWAVRGSCPLPLLIWGGVLTVAVLAERWRYRRIEEAKDGQWQKTGERFVDPETGKLVEVYYDPASGDRRYVDTAAEQTKGR